MTPSQSPLFTWRSILFKATLLIVIALTTMSDPSTASAPPPIGTLGHTAALVNNTIYIQGGMTRAGTFSNASYAIILDENKSLGNATWFDISKLRAFNLRKSAVSVPTDSGMITCGGLAKGTVLLMTCDRFNLAWNNTEFTVDDVSLRGALAVGYQKTSVGTTAYFIGGSSPKDEVEAGLDIANIPSGSSSAITWSKGPDMPIKLRFHTATWVGSPLGGVVVLGGRRGFVEPESLGNPYVYRATHSFWTTQ
jgi:hypothetical protein